MAQLKCPPTRFSGDPCGLQDDWIPRRAAAIPPQPTRFTIQEWNLASALTKDAADADRQTADHMHAESIRVYDETNEITARANADVELEFQKRLAQVKHWNEELQRKFDDINSEIDAEGIYRQRLENALASMCHILEVDTEIIGLREQRIGVELVYDEPQKQVIQEIKIVQGVREVLTRTLEFVAEQMRLLRKTGYNLDRELIDKNKALEIDEYAKTLNVHRSEVRPQCDLDFSEYRDADEHDWEEITTRNKLNAEKVINASLQLRVKVDSLLRQACEDIQQQLCLTNNSFETRLKELYRNKDQLQTQHSEIHAKTREMEGLICQLRRAFEEKKGSMALAETRLSLRGKRPTSELVKDSLQRRLLLEVHQLHESMAKLNTKIIQSQNVQRNLLRNQLELEDAINMKMTSIAIDDTKVMPLRKGIHVTEY